MNTTTQRLVSVEQVASLIETYGSNTQCWPEQERAAAIAVMAGSSELQRLYQQAEQLDNILLTASDAGTAPQDDALLNRIVDNLPSQPRRHYWQWTAGLAASLLLAVLVVNTLPDQDARGRGTELAITDMDYQMWQEVTGQDTLDTADDTVTDFMGLIELESSQG